MTMNRRDVLEYVPIPIMLPVEILFGYKYFLVDVRGHISYLDSDLVRINKLITEPKGS